MSTTVATGQITIIDLTDQRTSYFYLEANQSKIQTYDSAEQPGKFEPNFNSDHLIITPHFFFGNDEVGINDYSRITYSIEKGSGSYAEITTGSTSTAVGSNQCIKIEEKLYITTNIGEGLLNGTKTIRVKATLSSDAYTDNITQLGNPKDIEATIEFARVDSGKKGLSVSGVTQLYSFQSADAKPANPTDQNTVEGDPVADKVWSTSIGATPPVGKYLWLSTKITYSDESHSYTVPYTDPSWAKAIGEMNSLKKDFETIQKQVDSAIDTWYLEGDPTAEDFINPWLRDDFDDDADDSYHVGDLYYDKNTGLSYRFLYDDPNEEDGIEETVYFWQLIPDGHLSAALGTIVGLQTEIDGKATVYYGDEANLDGVRVGDLWIKSDGSFYECTSISGAQPTWSLASFSPQTITQEYLSWPMGSADEPSHEEQGWSPASPEWREGYQIWSRIKTVYNGLDESGEQKVEYSDPVCIQAAAARSITITGDQAFISQDHGQTFSGPIVLTANCIGGMTVGDWFLQNGSSWTQLNNSGQTTLTVSAVAQAGQTDFFPNNASSATIKVTGAVSPEQYYDVISLFKVMDGVDGAPAPSVFLTNENITFSADGDGKVADAMVYCNIVAYEGSKKVTPTINKNGITGAIDDELTITTSNVGDEIQVSINVAANATLGGAGPQQGAINIPVTYPAEATLTISWSKVNTGATGLPGASAILAELRSTSDRANFTDLQPAKIDLEAILYEGAEQKTASKYEWTFIPSVGEIAIDSTGKTASIERENVMGMMTVTCKMTYNDEVYVAYFTIHDRTDDIQCTITSTNGDKFTNGMIDTVLICEVSVDGVPVSIDGDPDWNYYFNWKQYEDGALVDWHHEYVANSHNSQVRINPKYVNRKAVFSCEITRTAKASQ